MSPTFRRATLTRRALPTLGVCAALVAGTLTAGTIASGASTPSRSSSVIIFLKGDSSLGLKAGPREAGAHALTAPLVAQLRAADATHVKAATSLPIVYATVSAAERSALAANPAVQAVFPNSIIRETRTSPAATLSGVTGKGVAPRQAPNVCGTATDPELDPEALSVIHADQTIAAGDIGTNVTVAYIADGVDPTDPDYSRNAAYASAGSPQGSPVLTEENFTGDPAGTPTAGGEAFLDSSSIAAQGNEVYDLNNYVNSGHQEAQSPCDIKIVGAAPGASVLGLDVFSTDYDTTESNFVQAIDYAVTAGAKVLNESFGSNQFPDTALDATRDADDDAVAAGVTVVVSSGDAGVTSTLGSPSTDPNLISVGASTTFRSYEQTTYGGINDPAANGTWIDNNISSLSSGGFSQSGGNTVDLVAPGDLNWALCSSDISLFQDCSNYDFNNTGTPIQQTGGTSESAPLTSAAAADVISAYAASHHGADPTPALVKQILMSSATDIDAPADQQGAGLLNVEAAVKLAQSLPGTTATRSGGLLVSPNQINITQDPGMRTRQPISITNTSNHSVTVHLSTRALTHVVVTHSGTFCMNPSAATIPGCGPPTTTSFPIWSDVVEVYQNVTFHVPTMTGPSRLDFSADYPYTGQASLLHVALIDPAGAYAGYSLPQGLADYANVQVADPMAGTWTAVFFTEQDNGSSDGTSGVIQWSAVSSRFESAGTISPATLTIGAGATRTAHLTVRSPHDAGDAAQSVVLTTTAATTTIPVTVRTEIATSSSGGRFAGVLTGGNGRQNPAQTNTYAFRVPSGKKNVAVGLTFNDPNDAVVGFLVAPSGEAVSSSSSITLNGNNQIVGTNTMDLYADAPEAGTWLIVLDWLQPVSGDSLSDPFSGAVNFDAVHVSSTLPQSSATHLTAGHAHTFDVRVYNTGIAPQAYFLDPRTSGTENVPMLDLGGSYSSMTLPLAPGLSFPYFVVPSHTTELSASLTGSAPVSFDLGLFTGDPDVATGAPGPNVVVAQSGDSASASISGPEISPGFWYLNPSEIGPYGSGGAPAVTASATITATTQTFDSTVSSPTGDLWSYYAGISGPPSPALVQPTADVTIPVTITPTAAPGTVVHGVIYVNDTFLVNEDVGTTFSGGDEIAAIPFTYKVS